ncbi:16255_t:CDS:2, partial [Rhizophagus irregularis]
EKTESHECLPCIGLFGDSYTNYATSTPSDYSGKERPEVVGKRLFPVKFSHDALFFHKKLNKEQIQEFNTTLQVISLWKIDQFEGVIRSVKCTVMTTNLSDLCGECIDLKNNTRLKDAIKSISLPSFICWLIIETYFFFCIKRRAIPLTFKFIPKFYFNTRLIDLIKNQNLRSLWTCIITNNNDSAMWASLAQMGMNGSFSGEKTFTELASLMLQIKIKEEAGISMKGLQYSEHFTHFFSLLSESSREYEVFRKALDGMSIQRIHQIHASNTELITDPNLVLDNVTKFACITKELKWEGPILLMTDYTKICSKLVYSQKLGYITGSTLPSSEVSVSDINDIHEKICNIYENNAFATQVQVIVLKIPIGKIPLMVIAILPTKDDKSAEQIFNIL